MKKFLCIMLSIIFFALSFDTTACATSHIYEDEGYCPDVMYTNSSYTVLDGYFKDIVKVAPGTVPVGTPVKILNIQSSGYYFIEYFDEGHRTIMYAPVKGLNISVEDAMAEDAEQRAIMTAIGNRRFILSFLPSEYGLESVTKKPIRAEGIPYPNEDGLGQLQYTGLYEYLTIIRNGKKTYEPTKAIEYTNSDTDPFALYLNDSYEQIYQRMVLATYYGYNYLIVLTGTVGETYHKEAIAEFEKNFGLKTTKEVWYGNTTMCYSEYGSTPLRVSYEVYTW